MNIQNFKIVPCDIEKTEQNAKLSVGDMLPKSNYHRMIRVYQDGTYYFKDIRNDFVFNHVAYNATYRTEAAIILDGIVVFLPEKFGLEKLQACIISIAEKMPLKRPRHRRYQYSF